MKSSLFIIVFFLITATNLYGQHLLVRDHYGKKVNSDTLTVIFHPDSNHGWRELSLELFVQNTHTQLITVVAKKTEYYIRPDEYHSICFGGTCFDSSTFISPFKDPVAPGAIDSTFSGHFRFDDILHPHGVCTVAYTFYDDNNPADSAIVYVKYNTMQKSGINDFTLNQKPPFLLYPNPAKGYFNIENLSNNPDEEILEITLYNPSGACIYKQTNPTHLTNFNIHTDTLPTAIYFIEIKTEKKFYVEKFSVH